MKSRVDSLASRIYVNQEEMRTRVSAIQYKIEATTSAVRNRGRD
jgi:hypothetical protein